MWEVHGACSLVCWSVEIPVMISGAISHVDHIPAHGQRARLSGGQNKRLAAYY